MFENLVTPLMPGDTRKPIAGFLNYRAHVAPDPRIPMGPNTMRELLWPVTVEYLEGGGTRVGFAYAPPPDMVERISMLADGAR